MAPELVAQLQAFAESTEKELALRGTSGADRNAVHRWVETHDSAQVREWKHVSALDDDGAKVLRLTKPAATASVSAAPAATAASTGGSTTVAVGGNVHDRLEEFLASNRTRMELTGTDAADRSATHSWVEGHASAAVRAWGHKSTTVGGQRVMVLTKPDGAEGGAAAAAGGQPEQRKKKKRRKRKGPASTEGLSEEEIKRREWSATPPLRPAVPAVPSVPAARSAVLSSVSCAAGAGGSGSGVCSCGAGRRRSRRKPWRDKPRVRSAPPRIHFWSPSPACCGGAQACRRRCHPRADERTTRSAKATTTSRLSPTQPLRKAAARRGGRSRARAAGAAGAGAS